MPDVFRLASQIEPGSCESDSAMNDTLRPPIAVACSQDTRFLLASPHHVLEYAGCSDVRSLFLGIQGNRSLCPHTGSVPLPPSARAVRSRWHPASARAVSCRSGWRRPPRARSVSLAPLSGDYASSPASHGRSDWVPWSPPIAVPRWPDWRPATYHPPATCHPLRRPRRAAGKRATVLLARAFPLTHSRTGRLARAARDRAEPAMPETGTALACGKMSDVTSLAT